MLNNPDTDEIIYNHSFTDEQYGSITGPITKLDSVLDTIRPYCKDLKYSIQNNEFYVAYSLESWDDYQQIYWRIVNILGKNT